MEIVVYIVSIVAMISVLSKLLSDDTCMQTGKQ